MIPFFCRLCTDSLPSHVPQVLINREPLRHLNFDVELLGDCDIIVNELCHRLGGHFSELCSTASPANEIATEDVELPVTSAAASDSNIHTIPMDSVSTSLAAKDAAGDNVPTISAAVPVSSSPTSSAPTATKNAADDVIRTESGTGSDSALDSAVTDGKCSTSVEQREEGFPKTESVNWASLLKGVHR